MAELLQQDIEYEYEGMVMGKMGTPPAILDRLKETTFDDNDIILATYTKCGTTWMQEIIYLVETEGDFEGADSISVYKRFDFVEVVTDGVIELDQALAKSPPRLIKTHLSRRFFQKTLDNTKAKFIVVFRNPKDMLVSYYNFYKMATFQFDKDGTWEEFFERFKKGKIVWGNYFDTQLSYWAYRDDPRMLIVKFEDMLKDPEKAVRQVADHLNKKLSDDLVKKIVERTSFKSMKSNPKLNYSECPYMDHTISPFMRKGRVGDWKNYFCEEQRKLVDKISKERFEPQGLFLEDE